MFQLPNLHSVCFISQSVCKGSKKNAHTQARMHFLCLVEGDSGYNYEIDICHFENILRFICSIQFFIVTLRRNPNEELEEIKKELLN